MRFKKNSNGLLNALDLSIIIIAICIIIAALFKIYNKQIFMLFDKTHSCTITISITDEELSTGKLKSGDKIYLSETGNFVGTVVSVKNIKEKKYTAINSSLMYDYSDKNIGVLIEIETKVKIIDGKKYINSSKFVTPGTKLLLNTDKYSNLNAVVDEIHIK